MNRKTIILFVFAALVCSTAAYAGDKNKKGKKTEATSKNDSTEIHWLSIDEVQVAMKKKPKKVWFDVYTGWCGWCKVMDKKTFSNKDVIKYMNENFYSVKLDAESKDTIRFMGKSFGFVAQYRANQFAVEIMRGQMSYPTGVFMEEQFQNWQSIPGYHDVKEMEMILKYLGDNHYKTQKFDDYRASFKPSWAVDVSPGQESAVPAVH